MASLPSAAVTGKANPPALPVTTINIMADPLISNHHVKNGKYTQAFLDQNGPGDTRPTALDILKDNDRTGTMKDKVSITAVRNWSLN